MKEANCRIHVSPPVQAQGRLLTFDVTSEIGRLLHSRLTFDVTIV